MRGPRAMLAAGAMILAVTGCGTATGAGSAPEQDPPSASVTSAPTNQAGSTDPLQLIGIWRVTGTDEAPGTLLRLDPAQLSLWRACGQLDGSWRADQAGNLVADAGQSGSGSCFTGHDTALTMRPAWLAAATAFRVDGTTRLLLDDHGTVTARLVPATGSASSTRTPSAFDDPPKVDDAGRRWLAVPDPLPADLRPATAASLAGRWLPIEKATPQRRMQPFLQLEPDRSWTASDGCNGTMGRWMVTDGGRIFGTDAASTAIGCNNVEVASALGSAGRAGFDQDTLVLLDPQGSVLMRFARAAG